MLIKEGDYAGVGLGFSVKMSSGFWAFGLAITVVLLPLYPPTHAFGMWGWVLVAVSLPVSILFAIALRRHPERMTMDRLFTQSCVSVSQIAFLEWMAGGAPAPYGALLGFALFGIALGHPLRRSIPFAVFVVALTFLPLLYGRHGFPLGMVATTTAVSLSIATFVALIMSHTRRQRARLAKEGDAARSESLTDSLTDLGNRRAFNRALDAAVAQGHGLVMLLDIDNFKTINDNHGHPVGDECLVAYACAA
jgi:Diguanylate cyclase, GGDEF domain